MDSLLLELKQVLIQKVSWCDATRQKMFDYVFVCLHRMYKSSRNFFHTKYDGLKTMMMMMTTIGQTLFYCIFKKKRKETGDKKARIFIDSYLLSIIYMNKKKKSLLLCQHFLLLGWDWKERGALLALLMFCLLWRDDEWCEKK